MKHFLLVFLGGGFGSVLRYWISRFTSGPNSGFPYGTFTVNILGSLFIGIILGYTLKTNTVAQNTVLLLVMGFCGGFTTFSTFAYENYIFLKNGDITTFALYTLTSLILGIASVILGVWLVKFI